MSYADVRRPRKSKNSRRAMRRALASSHLKDARTVGK